MLSKLALGGYIVLFISLYNPVCDGLCSDISVIWLPLQYTLVSLQLFLLYGSSEWEWSKNCFKSISIFSFTQENL